MAENLPQPMEKHPPQYQRDLNPETPGAGQNAGPSYSQDEKNGPNAADLKEMHEQLSEFTNDELAQITILLPGTRLEQGATYLDLNNREQGPIKATGDMVAEDYNKFVAKSGVDYQLWNRLCGITDPERTGQ